MNPHPGKSGLDEAILSPWTYLQVAATALVAYLFWQGPSTYQTAFTFTMLAHAVFMQRLGLPVGINSAAILNGWGLQAGWATGERRFCTISSLERLPALLRSTWQR